MILAMNVRVELEIDQVGKRLSVDSGFLMKSL